MNGRQRYGNSRSVSQLWVMSLVVVATFAIGAATAQAAVELWDPDGSAATNAVLSTTVDPGTSIQIDYPLPESGCPGQYLMVQIAWYNPATTSAGPPPVDGEPAAANDFDVMWDPTPGGATGDEQSLGTATTSNCSDELNNDDKRCTGMWKLLAPDPDGVGTGRVTATVSTGISHELIMGVGLACYVDQVSPHTGSNTGANDPGTTAQYVRQGVPAVSGALCFDIMATPLQVGATQIYHEPSQRQELGGSGAFYEDFMAVSWADGAASTAMSSHGGRIAVRNGYTWNGGIQWVEYEVADSGGTPLTNVLGVIGEVCLDPTGFTAAELSDVDIRLGELQDAGAGALIRWHASAEVDTLGYNIYRSTGAGGRVVVNPGLIAGSILHYPGINLEAGYSYGWFDTQATAGTSYWIEEINLRGERELHGPFGITDGAIDGDTASIPRSPLLSDVTKSLRPTASAVSTLRSNTIDDQAAKGRSDVVISQVSQFDLAAMHAAKLMVAEDGWYRVRFEDLVNAGFTTNALKASNIQLWTEGRQVAARIVGGEDGVVGAGDAIEFFGVASRTQYAAERTYWLVISEQPGVRIPLRLPGASNAPVIDGREAIKLEETLSYQPGAVNGAADNFYGRIALNGVDAVHEITLPAVSASPTIEPTLDVAIYGVFFGEPPATSSFRVDLNGTTLGYVDIDASGYRTQRFTIPTGVLADGLNQATLALASGEGVALVDSITMRYDRRSTAVDNAIDLEVPIRHGSAPLRIDGFSSPDVRVFDVTNTLRPTEFQVRAVSAEASWAVDVRPIDDMDGPLRRGSRIVAVTNDQIRTPRIALNQPSSWHAADGTTMAIITTRDLAPIAEPLAQLRRNQGLTVAVIDVEDLYDEFSFGIKSADAITAFLSHAASQWSTPLEYALLFGDASYDPIDYLGFNQDLVPTRLVELNGFETSSDTQLLPTTSNPSELIAIGRLPAHDLASAQRMVSKIIAYETNQRALAQASFVADEPIGDDFYGTNTEFAALLPPTMTSDQISVALQGTSAARQSILDAINNGTSFMHYSGHGSVGTWRGNILTAADAQTMTNVGNLTVVSAMTCLNGAFQEPLATSLAEALVRDSDGGAVVFVTSTSTNDPGDEYESSRQFIEAIGNPAVSTFGAAWINSLASASDVVRSTTVFIGDPATRIYR